ncbi:MAG: putative toxin-antitoxin system toxin component, PIN family [Deltaproteobacteria bacterium]|nr:putative toxin-antitoxin system toxin component, PIN family [Deltaproteobacteria bacterium]
MKAAPRIVLDTNVLVAALLHPDRKPARVVALVFDGQLHLLVDERILAEYDEVLRRSKFRFAASNVDALLLTIRLIAESVVAPPLGVHLPDGGDIAFAEVAVGGHADALVTGNARHFPQDALPSVQVVSPAELLRRLTLG